MIGTHGGLRPEENDHPPSRASAAGLYAGLVALACLVNYPGRLTADSLDQLAQSENPQILTDWHSPTTTWLWSLLDPLLGQPAAALAIQAALIFTFPALLASRMLADRKPLGAVRRVAAGAVCAVLLATLVFASGQIVKDMLLVGLISALLACMSLHRPDGRRRYLHGAIACAAFVLLVRPTDFLMMFVAAILVLLCGFSVPRRRFASAVLGLVVVCGLALPLTKFVSLVLLGAQPSRLELSLLIFDAAGISAASGDNRFLALADWPAAAVPPPERCYTPERWDAFMWGPCDRYFPLLSERADRLGTASLLLWWGGSILRHPLAYLRHRLDFARSLLFSNNMVGGDFAVNTADTADALRGRPVGGVTFTQGIDMSGAIRLWTPHVAVRPFAWVATLVSRAGVSALALVFCLYALAWCRRRRAAPGCDPAVVASAAFGVANFVMYLPFGVADDGRYLHPTLFCGAFALIGILQHRPGPATLEGQHGGR